MWLSLWLKIQRRKRTQAKIRCQKYKRLPAGYYVESFTAGDKDMARSKLKAWCCGKFWNVLRPPPFFLRRIELSLATRKNKFAFLKQFIWLKANLYLFFFRSRNVSYFIISRQFPCKHLPTAADTSPKFIHNWKCWELVWGWIKQTKFNQLCVASLAQGNTQLKLISVSVQEFPRPSQQEIV